MYLYYYILRKKYTLPSRDLIRLQIVYLHLETPTLTPELLPFTSLTH